MSSAAYNRLRGIFTTNTATATASATATATATATDVSASVKPTSKTPKRNSKTPKKPTTTTSTTTDATVSQPKTIKPLPMSHLTDSLQNLKIFIDRFKRASNTGSFRYSYKYYEDAVDHLSRHRQHYYIEQILEHQKRYENDMTNEPFVARLISLYGKSRMYDHARKVFDEMPKLNCPRTVLSANALLTACVNSKRVNEIPELFRELREDLSIEPDEVSYNVLIKVFCDMGATDPALQVIDEMEKKGRKSSVYTYNTILDALYRNAQISEADRQWEVMKSKNLEPDTITYNAKVRGLIVDKRIEDAIGMLDEMRSNGVSPDVYTYNGLIHGFVKQDDLIEVKKWYAEMAKNKIDPDSVTFRMVIAFATKKGDYRFGFELCKEGLRRGINVGRPELKRVLDGLQMEAAIDEAKELVELVNGSKFIFYKLKMFDDL